MPHTPTQNPQFTRADKDELSLVASHHLLRCFQVKPLIHRHTFTSSRSFSSPPPSLPRSHPSSLPNTASVIKELIIIPRLCRHTGLLCFSAEKQWSTDREKILSHVRGQLSFKNILNVLYWNKLSALQMKIIRGLSLGVIFEGLSVLVGVTH